MKKTLLLLVLTLSICPLLFTSCEKRLAEVEPQTALNRATILSDPNAAMTLYYGVYSAFRGYQATLLHLGEMRSDIWAEGVHTESEEPTLVRYTTHNINVNTVPAGNWGGLYSLLDKVNTVISLFPQTSVEQNLKNRSLAEMYGIRAYIYYTLLKTWGAVPLALEPVTQVGNLTDLYKERASEQAVMTQIKADVEQSMSLFNGVNTFATKRVYWNLAATLTLKGDVFIWSAEHLGGGTADLQVAKQALEQVKGIANLGLLPVYADLFAAAREANNREIIFAFSYELNQVVLTSYANFLVNATQAGTLIFDPLTNPQLVSQAYPFVAGASRAGMSVNTITKLNDPDDSRIRASIRVMYRNNPPAYPIAGVFLTKFVGRVNAGAQLYDTDFPVFRFADVLILLAEAKAKLGEDPSAEINSIRERAYGTGYTPHTNGTIDENMEAILEENLREFIGEAKRWFALRRAGDKWVFNYINPIFLSTGEEYRLLMPITLAMLNSDPKLIQTPGY